MAINLPALETLNAVAVAQATAAAVEWTQEGFAGVDLSARGVVGDLVIASSAQLLAAYDSIVGRLRDSFSALLAGSDPDLADPGIIDAIAANARLSRLPGAPAAGGVALLVRALSPFNVPAGTVFVANGVSFISLNAHDVRVSVDDVVDPTDLVLAASGPGAFSVVVPVAAETTGPAGLIRRGAGLIPSITIPFLVTAYADSDFVGGISAETNASLVQRFQLGLAASAPSNRVTAEAMLRSTPGLSAVSAVSIVGFGDAEMHRDQHTILPVSTGGRVDVYIRSASVPVALSIVVTATLIDVTADGGLWQFSLGRDAAPGFYSVARVAAVGADPASASLPVTATIRGLDLAADAWAPDLISPAEAAYSRYQAATVRFTDAGTPTASLVIGQSGASYAASVLYMPGIALAQATLGARAARHWGSDILVRAAVPCVTAAWCEIRRPPLTPEPTALQLAAASAAAAAIVNATGFAGRLASSPITRAIEAALPPGCEAGPLDLFGTITGLDGAVRALRDAGRAGEIIVPYLPVAGITARTVCFFLSPADVSFALVVLPGDA